MREAKISSGDEDKHNVSVENEETTAGTAKLSEELQLPPHPHFPQLKITDESRDAEHVARGRMFSLHSFSCFALILLTPFEH